MFYPDYIWEGGGGGVGGILFLPSEAKIGEIFGVNCIDVQLIMEKLLYKITFRQNFKYIGSI